MPALTRDPEVAANALRRGRLAALPTDTVYGLAADATRPEAVRRVFEVKGRPTDHPVIVHIAAADLRVWAPGASDSAAALARAFWPGPLTVVVAKADWVSPVLTGGQETVALRCVDHPDFAAVLAGLVADGAAAAGPVGLAAPSANRFGRVSPTTAEHVLAGLGDRLAADDVVLDGGTCSIGVESTIVDCAGPTVSILRPGAIGFEEIGAALVAAGVTTSIRPVAGDRGSRVRTPGALPSHYAPTVPVRIIEPGELADECAAGVGLLAPAGVPTPSGVTRIASPRDGREYAHGLYSWLRAADQLGCRELLVVLPTPTGGDPVSDALAVAVGDRAARATAGRTAQLRFR